MAALNHVVVIGNLTRDPELKEFDSGSMTRMTVAVNNSYKDKEGERVDDPCFIDAQVWGPQSESCERYLHKGSKVCVEGKLVQDRWEDDDGNSRSVIRIRAFNVQFLDPAEGRGEGSSKKSSSGTKRRRRTTEAGQTSPPDEGPPVDDDDDTFGLFD